MDPKLAKELNWIETATHAELKATWPKYCPGWALPKKPSIQFLRLAIAWKAQERVLGGLSDRAKAALLGPDPDNHPKKSQPKDTILPGTILRREWRGNLYEVMTLEDGFAYEGQTHKSLSEIARLITGTRWNGPAFFGLRSKVKKTKSPTMKLEAAE